VNNASLGHRGTSSIDNVGSTFDHSNSGQFLRSSFIVALMRKLATLASYHAT